MAKTIKNKWGSLQVWQYENTVKVATSTSTLPMTLTTPRQCRDLAEWLMKVAEEME